MEFPILFVLFWKIEGSLGPWGLVSAPSQWREAPPRPSPPSPGLVGSLPGLGPHPAFPLGAYPASRLAVPHSDPRSQAGASCSHHHTFHDTRGSQLSWGRVFQAAQPVWGQRFGAGRGLAAPRARVSVHPRPLPERHLPVLPWAHTR